MKTITSYTLALILTLTTVACNEQVANDPPQPPPPIKEAQKVAAQSSQNVGRLVYAENCASCHDTGVANAPKIGDRENWSRHAEHGTHHLMHAVLEGKGTMPPRGGNPELSDNEIEEAINFILDQSL